ncbi:hypothetical protein HDU76_001244 [Blyttiomyces sp. JEL0837]|nr:hypothetical protein HDU76_001244 [Blyttiomyces sp. JEL0837]
MIRVKEVEEVSNEQELIRRCFLRVQEGKVEQAHLVKNDDVEGERPSKEHDIAWQPLKGKLVDVADFMDDAESLFQVGLRLFRAKTGADKKVIIATYKGEATEDIKSNLQLLVDRLMRFSQLSDRYVSVSVFSNEIRENLAANSTQAQSPTESKETSKGDLNDSIKATTRQHASMLQKIASTEKSFDEANHRLSSLQQRLILRNKELQEKKELLDSLEKDIHLPPASTNKINLPLGAAILAVLIAFIAILIYIRG